MQAPSYKDLEGEKCEIEREIPSLNEHSSCCRDKTKSNFPVDLVTTPLARIMIGEVLDSIFGISQQILLFVLRTFLSYGLFCSMYFAHRSL